MNKKNYLKASVEIIEFRAEKGFAASAGSTSYDDGGGFGWDGGGSGSTGSDDDDAPVWDF